MSPTASLSNVQNKFTISGGYPLTASGTVNEVSFKISNLLNPPYAGSFVSISKIILIITITILGQLLYLHK